MEDQNMSMGAAVCRICMCGETSIPYLGKQAGEPLISPCRCSGTMGLYHRSCLEHWLTLTKTKNCEICKFSFKITQKSRNFIDYIRQRGYEKRRNDPDNRNPFVDISFVLVITPLACIALFLCIRGAALAGQKYHFAFENRESEDNGRNLEIRNETSMEFALFVFVAVILFFVYNIFLLVMLMTHITQYKTWQMKNMILFVVDQLDAEQSMHYNPHWNKCQMGWKAKVVEFWRKMRGQTSSRTVTLEIERSNGILIEPIVGISPTPNQDATSRQLTLSPIGLDDLPSGSASPLSHHRDSRSIGMRKTQSVYSVCSSFGNGILRCSTPVVSSSSSSSNLVSSFKADCSYANASSHEDVQNTVTADAQRGRFHVERLDTPRF